MKHPKQLETILPPDVVADIGEVLCSGLPPEAVTKNLQALLKSQEPNLVKEGLTAGMLVDLLVNQQRKPRI